MASTAGTITLKASMQGVQALGVAHVMANPFPWWILLLLVVATALTVYLLNRRRHASTEPIVVASDSRKVE